MRHLVIVLMLALLPLRMWAADGMLNGMALAGLGGAPAAAGAAMPADCPMLAGQQAPQDGESGGLMASCLSCQLCAAIAAPPVHVPAGTKACFASVAGAASRFASAHLLPDLKPPIS